VGYGSTVFICIHIFELASFGYSYLLKNEYIVIDSYLLCISIFYTPVLLGIWRQILGWQLVVKFWAFCPVDMETRSYFDGKSWILCWYLNLELIPGFTVTWNKYKAFLGSIIHFWGGSLHLKEFTSIDWKFETVYTC